MRAITEKAALAFENNSAFRNSNTVVTVENGVTKLILHCNTIAIKENNVLKITNFGWQTTTTKERLNGLTGVRINQKAGIWYLNDKEWNGNLITV